MRPASRWLPLRYTIRACLADVRLWLSGLLLRLDDRLHDDHVHDSWRPLPPLPTPPLQWAPNGEPRGVWVSGPDDATRAEHYLLYLDAIRPRVWGVRVAPATPRQRRAR